MLPNPQHNFQDVDKINYHFIKIFSSFTEEKYYKVCHKIEHSEGIQAGGQHTNPSIPHFLNSHATVSTIHKLLKFCH